VVTTFAAVAASAFEGVWKVKDTVGHPFEITLSSDGAAKATRGEGMTGIAASSGRFTLNREIPVCSGLRGGAERTQT
jgi:hypothetical protein